MKELGYAAAHSPAALQHVRPLDRERPAGRAGRGGVGSIVSPARAGLLTNKYLGGGIPADSRAASKTGALQEGAVHAGSRGEAAASSTPSRRQRGQSLAQMSLAWVLRGGRVTSALMASEAALAGSKTMSRR